jgi:hypothetical protein
MERSQDFAHPGVSTFILLCSRTLLREKYGTWWNKSLHFIGDRFVMMVLVYNGTERRRSVA